MNDHTWTIPAHRGAHYGGFFGRPRSGNATVRTRLLTRLLV